MWESHSLRVATLSARAPAGSASAWSSSARAAGTPLSEPATANQSVVGRVGLQPDLPAQLAAGALAEGAVVARGGRGAVRRAHHGRVLRAAVVGPELRGRSAGSGPRPAPPSRGARRWQPGRAVLAEQQGIAGEGAGVGQVEGRRRWGWSSPTGRRSSARSGRRARAAGCATLRDVRVSPTSVARAPSGTKSVRSTVTLSTAS